MIKKVIRDVIINDATITADLATYTFTTGSTEPAVFTTNIIPRDADFPAVIIDQSAGDMFGCRDKRGGELIIEVRVYDDKDKTEETIYDLALNIWKLLDRVNIETRLNIEGYEDWGCQADPPIQQDDPDGYPGYLIRVRPRILET